MRVAIIDDDKSFREIFGKELQKHFIEKEIDLEVSDFANLNEYSKKSVILIIYFLIYYLVGKNVLSI